MEGGEGDGGEGEERKGGEQGKEEREGGEGEGGDERLFVITSAGDSQYISLSSSES